MTYGRPPHISNSYMHTEPALEVDLETLDLQSGPDVQQQPPQLTNSVSCFVQSL